jgi:hypothetical protein
MDKDEKPMGYQYIVDKFGKEKVEARSKWLYSLLDDYIKMRKYEDKVEISEDVLEHVLIDYFVDIDRLKEFADIKKANESKIYAYTCFWLVRHKPLQLKQGSNSRDLVFVNEEFVVHLLCSYLFSQPDSVPIVNARRDAVDLFVRTLLYYFKYREYSAKNIELMILAFEAGRGYQYSADYQNGMKE